MTLSKSYRGYIRAHPRHPVAVQCKALEEAGCGFIHVEGKDDCAREDFIMFCRVGDLVVIKNLFLLAEPRKTTRDKPRKDLWLAINEIEERGASILETSTGYRSTDKTERDRMICAAIEMLTYGGRRLPAKQARENGLKGGRKPMEFSDDELKQAETAWFNMRYKTNDEAEKRFPKGFKAHRAYKLWGPSGRPTNRKR